MRFGKNSIAKLLVASHFLGDDFQRQIYFGNGLLLSRKNENYSSQFTVWSLKSS